MFRDIVVRIVRCSCSIRMVFVVFGGAGGTGGEPIVKSSKRAKRIITEFQRRQQLWLRYEFNQVIYRETCSSVWRFGSRGEVFLVGWLKNLWGGRSLALADEEATRSRFICNRQALDSRLQKVRQEESGTSSRSMDDWKSRWAEGLQACSVEHACSGNSQLSEGLRHDSRRRVVWMGYTQVICLCRVTSLSFGVLRFGWREKKRRTAEENGGVRYNFLAYGGDKLWIRVRTPYGYDMRWNYFLATRLTEGSGRCNI